VLRAAARQRHDGVVIVSVGACARAFNFLDPVDPATGNHHRWLTNGQDTWRARYAEPHTLGSEECPRKRDWWRPQRRAWCLPY
jgi:hypothetical protein